MKSRELIRYWISWYEPGEDPRPARDWKRAPDWWCTGYVYSEDAKGNEVVHTTICAVVDAKNESEARRIVRKFWKPKEWRFCGEREAGWEPQPDRFPCKEKP
jgi:hypothetical protein